MPFANSVTSHFLRRVEEPGLPGPRLPPAVARAWAQGSRKEWTVSEPCSQIMHYWSWRVKNARTQSRGALSVRSAWKEHPCHFRSLGKVDQPPRLRSQPWNQSLSLVFGAPSPSVLPLWGWTQRRARRTGDSLSIGFSNGSKSVQSYSRSGVGGVVFSIENFNTRPSFHCIIQNTKIVLGEQ